ncbi:hypothetical protein BY996DRAFT_7015588 [Phakopsora pachyrhizi]|nr:hypothetical protein BY996DRAFT_7015588 [Phakopsora pachyrhizi]
MDNSSIDHNSLLDELRHDFDNSISYLKTLIDPIEHDQSDKSILKLLDEISLEAPSIILRSILNLNSDSNNFYIYQTSSFKDSEIVLKRLSNFGNLKEFYLSITNLILKLPYELLLFNINNETFQQLGSSDTDDCRSDSSNNSSIFNKPNQRIIYIIIPILISVFNRIVKSSKNPISFYVTLFRCIKTLLRLSEPIDDKFSRLIFHQIISGLETLDPTVKISKPYKLILLLTSLVLLFKDQSKNLGMSISKYCSQYPSWYSTFYRISKNHSTQTDESLIIDEDSDQFNRRVIESVRSILRGELLIYNSQSSTVEVDTIVRMMNTQNFSDETTEADERVRSMLEVIRKLSNFQTDQQDDNLRLTRTGCLIIHSMNQFLTEHSIESVGSHQIISSNLRISTVAIIDLISKGSAQICLESFLTIINSTNSNFDDDQEALIEVLIDLTTGTSDEINRFLTFRTLVQSIDNLIVNSNHQHLNSDGMMMELEVNDLGFKRWKRSMSRLTRIPTDLNLRVAIINELRKKLNDETSIISRFNQTVSSRLIESNISNSKKEDPSDDDGIEGLYNIIKDLINDIEVEIGVAMNLRLDKDLKQLQELTMIIKLMIEKINLIYLIVKTRSILRVSLSLQFFQFIIIIIKSSLFKN